MEKPIHGEPEKLWKKLGLQEKCPIECDFNIGDLVIFTNDYGVKFDAEVIGFSSDDDWFSKKYGKYIHIGPPGGDVNGWAWRFPHSQKELIKGAI